MLSFTLFDGYISLHVLMVQRNQGER